jgi:protein ImuB
MSRRILCIWFPHWPLQRVVVAWPELKDHAVVLTEPHPRGGERVVHCSRAAHALGVRAGMPVAEVGPRAPGKRFYPVPDRPAGEDADPPIRHRDISGNSSSLPAGTAGPTVLPADPIADHDALVRLAHWCHRFSPTVGLEEDERPESLLLDVTGIGRLFGGEDRLLEQAAGALRDRGYRPRLAIADTIGAAWAVAHFTPTPADPKSQIPNPKSEICNLKSLPLAALRLPEETLGLLAQLGIHRIEQLVALPRDQLESRFGPLLLRRLDQALGAADEVIQPLRPPPDLSAEQFFEHPTAEPEVIEAVIERLLARLVQGLAARGQGATQLTCRLSLQDGPPLVLDVGLYRPTATARHLHELIRMQLEPRRLKSPIENITLVVLAAEPLGQRQQELFVDDRSRAHPALLARLIDRLAGRLGHRGVVRPRLVRDAQPELAVQHEPLVGTNSTVPPQKDQQSRRSRKTAVGKQRETRSSDPHFQPLERPLLLLPRPVPIRVISLLPDGPPAQFVYRGCTHRVARHWGPERIETGWWRRAGIRRDYWRAETTGGARFWLFRRLRDLAWFLHGVF